ncbi:hypothetical protein FLACHUCJ7_01132 [Flavobacterium chungangense]|uniref:Uncharacterized protein n=1 Tax=Flavobacterium chungangense TaxID=554283 RepID=A0A6V6YTW2_9FLAO|nr:hypothetical protein FLACHUCJ7_01132 [Flavobacterium chungangense]
MNNVFFIHLNGSILLEFENMFKLVAYRCFLKNQLAPGKTIPP